MKKILSLFLVGISTLLLVAFFSSKTQLKTPQSDYKTIQRADYEFAYCEGFEQKVKHPILTVYLKG
jgi:hypothetical protein